jgi:hypothetical protein
MNMERWEPAKMNRFSEKVMARLREEAKAMLLHGEETQSVDLGEQKDALWLSTNPEKIIGSEKIEMNGQVIYVGLLKEDME